MLALEIEFWPPAKVGMGDVYQVSAIVVDSTSFEFMEGVLAKTWGKMKRDEEDEEDFADRGVREVGQFQMDSHFLELLNNEMFKVHQKRDI